MKASGGATFQPGTPENTECISGGMRNRLADWRCWPWVAALIAAACSAPVFINGGPTPCADWPAWWSLCHFMKCEIVPEQRWLWDVIWSQGNGGMVIGGPYSLPFISALATELPGLYYTRSEANIHDFCRPSYFGSVPHLARPWCPRLIACVAGLVVLLRTIDLVNDGMWYDTASVAMALLFAVILSRHLRHPAAGSWTMACLLLTMALYTHPLGAVLGCSCWLGAFVHSAVHRSAGDPGRLATLALILLTSMLLAAPQLAALAESSNTKVNSATLYTAPVGSFKPAASDAMRLCAIVSIPAVIRLRRQDEPLSWMLACGLLAGSAIYLQVPSWLPEACSLVVRLTEYSDRLMMCSIHYSSSS